MGAEIEILKEAGIDIEAGKGFTGGEDKLVIAATRYAGNYEKNRAKVEEFFAAKDYENYMITVHSLKSNSKMIGATEIGKGFESLEMAARGNDIATIESQTAPVLNAYKELVDKIKPLAGAGGAGSVGAISADEAKEIAQALLEALDDFDDDKSKELAVKLTGYPFEASQADKLKKAIAFIDDFMYDDAAELVKSVIPSI